MPHSSLLGGFNSGGVTGVSPMPVIQPLYPGLPSTDDAVRMVPLPGVRCPTCAANGQEVWVIPGRACGNCGTPCY